MAGLDPTQALIAAAAGGTRPATGPALRRPVAPLPRPKPKLQYLPAVRAQQQAHQESKPRGLWDQIGDTFTNIIPGLVSLGGIAAKSATAPIRGAIDLARGDANLAEAAAPVVSALPGAVFATSAIAPKDVQAKYLPLQTQLRESFQRTGGNIIHPSRYGKAIDEGRIVDTILEDVGNLSLVAGGVGKALGAGARAAEAGGNLGRAAALERAATTAERVGALGGKLNDAPISIPRKGLELAGSGVVKGLERLAEGDGVLGRAATTLRERAPLLLTPEGRALNTARKATARSASRLGAAPTRALYGEVVRSGIPVAEQGAVTAIRTGIADIYDRLVASGVAPDEAQQIITSRDIAEQTFTPDVAAVLDARRDGTLAPEQQARMDSYGAEVDRLVQRQTDKDLRGEGLPGGPMDPRYLQDNVLDDRVVNAVDAAGYTMANVPPDVLNAILDNMEVWPAKWRPAMRAAGLANEAIAERRLPWASGAEASFYLTAGDLRAAIDEFDALPPDAVVTVYHGTTTPNAESLVKSRVSGSAPRGDSVSSVSQSDGVYVAPTYKDARSYAGKDGVVVAVKVRKGDVIPSPEAKGKTTGGALFHSFEGAVIPKGKKLLDAAIVDAQLPASKPTPLLPRRPSDMLAAGMESPGYLPGGRSEVVSPLSVGTGRAPVREGLSGIKDIGSEKFRASAEIQPFSARTLGEKLGGKAQRTTLNAGLVEMMQSPELKSVADVIDDTTRQSLRGRAQFEAAAGRGSPEQMAAAEANLYGRYVTEELKARGFEPLAGDRNAPDVGDFNPDARVAFNDIADDTVVLPKGLKGKLIPYAIGKDMNRLAQTLERINRRFKGAVLPFSIRWQMGDLIGGAFMSAVGGGIPPWELIDGMRAIGKLDDAGIEAVLNRPEFQDAGLNFEESRWMHETPDTPQPRTPIGKIQRKSFQLNAAINRYNRQGYLLAKLQRLLEEKGLTLDGVQSGGAWDDPVVQDAIVKAVDDANEVMGTFDEMTPFERRVIRNIFPFWAWNRHITQLAFRTAVDNPARMLWTLRLGSYGTDPDLELPSWLKGSIPVGGQLIPTNFLNPFNDVGGGSIYTPGGAVRALSPGIRLGAFAFGLDPSRGLSPTTRRYDAGNLDELAQENALRFDPSGLLYQTIKTFPLGRVALDVLPTGEIGGIGLGPHPRYHSGQLMVTRSGKPIDSSSRLRALAPLFGIPLPTPQSQVDPIMAAAAKRRAAALRRAENTVGYKG